MKLPDRSAITKIQAGIVAVAIIVVAAAGAYYFWIEAQPKEIELTMTVHAYELWNKVIQDQIDEYERLNPGVTIMMTVVPYGELATKSLIMLETGEASDIMEYYSGWLAPIFEGDYLDEAPAYVKEDLENNFLPSIVKQCTWNGKILGYAGSHQTGGMVPVNLDLWPKDVPLPKTWEEMYDANKEISEYEDSKIVKAGMMCFSAMRGGGAGWVFMQLRTLLLCYGTDIVDPDYTHMTFNNDAGHKAVEILLSFYQPELAAGMAGEVGSPQEPFLLSKTCAIMHGVYPSVYDGAGMNWEYISPLAGPAGEKLESIYYLYTVTKASDPAKKEAAWKFLNWLSASEQYDDQTDVAGRPPITFKSQEKYGEDPVWQSIMETLAVADPPLFHVKLDEMRVEALVELERAAAEEITIQEALNNIETKINQILAS